jgi:hypothetical protein
MKKVTFTLTIEFSDKISGDDEFQEIANKIADALVHECDCGNGLAPDQSDAFTESVEISNDILGVRVINSIR